MTGKAISSKDAIRILNGYGFYQKRTNGSHAIFKDDFGRTFTITIAKPLSQKTWRRECKKNGIEV